MIRIPAPSLLVFLLSILSAFAQTIVEDPVENVQSSRVFVWKREFAEIPKSASTRPYARINQVEPFSESNRWLGVNDLNGPM